MRGQESRLEPELERALYEKLLAMADDEFLLGHRNAEWTGHGPILEEDIAFSNIAQDEQGHATIWYGLVEGISGESPDRLVFFREAADFRSAPLVELPKGDWAFSMMRQFLFDAAERVWLPRLGESGYRPLAEAAAKIRTEEVYHYRHTSNWIRRLGLGTEESQRRTQQALDELWPYAQQLFAPLPGQAALVAAGYAPDPAETRRAWEGLVGPFLQEAGLTVPVVGGQDGRGPVGRQDAGGPAGGPVGGRSETTARREALLAEMQAVARLDPEAEW